MGNSNYIEDEDNYEEITDIEELKALHALKICINCGYFLMSDDDEPNFGVCTYEDVFEPYLDDIFEDLDFSCCYEIYKERRYDGDKEACADFSPVEYIYPDEKEDDSEIDIDLFHESMKEKYQNLDIPTMLQMLLSKNSDESAGILNQISISIQYEHKDAFDLLLDHYNSLGPVTELDETYKRIRILDILTYNINDDQRVLQALANELYRTESNNTTRQLYTYILKKFERCDQDKVLEPLVNLLSKKQFSYRMKKRIEDIIERNEEEDSIFRYIF